MPQNWLTDYFRLYNDQYTQEFRLSSRDQAPLRWLIGLYGSYEKQRTKDNYVMKDDYIASMMGMSGLGDVDMLNDTKVDVSNGAIFAQATYALTEKLFLTGGLRYDYVQKKLDSTGDNGDGGIMLGMAGPTHLKDTQNYSAILPKIAIEYRFAPDINVYASVSGGYKPGCYQTTLAAEADKAFDSEHTWNYEIGAKASFFENRLVMGLSGFYIQMEDQQLYTLTSTSHAIVSNAGKSHSIGFEAEVKTRPLPGLELFGAYGYVKTRVDDAGSSHASFDGASSPYSPVYHANAGIQYTMENGLLARVENVFVGPYFLDSENTTRQGSYSLLGARIGYETDSFGVYVFGQNLLNEKYYTTAFNNESMIPGQGMVGSMGMPRTFGVMARYEF